MGKIRGNIRTYLFQILDADGGLTDTKVELDSLAAAVTEARTTLAAIAADGLPALSVLAKIVRPCPKQAKPNSSFEMCRRHCRSKFATYLEGKQQWNPIRMPTTSKDVGRKLREAGKAMNYTFDDLAETCGLTIDEINEVEAGTTSEPDHVHRIASALGVKTD